MHTHSYPLFVPPDEVSEKSHREWSKQDADIYFEWRMKSLDDRIRGLLCFFGVPEHIQLDRGLLLDMGQRAAPALLLEEFSSVDDSGERNLTYAGYALAADMGLLTAKILLRTVDTIQWTIIRKPKNDMLYNWPVLTGFGGMDLEPVGGSIAEAQGILLGVRGPDVWARALDTWAGKALAHARGGRSGSQG